MSIVQALGMSFKVLIMGEYICQTKNSVGKIISITKSGVGYDDGMSELIAWGILLVIIVVLIENIIKLIVKKINKEKRYQS